MEAKRSKIIISINNLAKAVVEESRLWGRPEFHNLRNFVESKNFFGKEIN